MRAWVVVVMILGLGRVEASPEPRLELGLRAGWHHTVFHDTRDDEDMPDGTGLVLDSSIGGRILPWLSIAAFASVSWFHDSYIHVYEAGGRDERVRFVEVGPRVSVHFRGLLAGAGLAVSHVHEDTIDKSRLGDVVRNGDFAWEVKIWELHVGYTTPRIRALGGVAFQLLVMKTGMFSNANPADSTRILFGVEY